MAYNSNSHFESANPDKKRAGATIYNPVDAARIIVEDTSVNLFLTGKAGTGKTTFLRGIVNECRKRLVVLAPTGVAAINAGGTTIHSFFQLDFAPYIPGSPSGASGSKARFSRSKINLIRTLDLIIIDEISMVRPDVLDAIDAILRRLRSSVRPFGGVQMLLIGDLRQLAPVAQEKEWNLLRAHYHSPYFFESHALRRSGFLMVELTQVFRQSDPVFLDILNRIRDNTADGSMLEALNRRANPSLLPDDNSDNGYVRLTTHNYRADNINSRRLAMIKQPTFTYKAEIKGKFPESSYPAETTLELKVGAQVMFIKNDPSFARDYYNGLIGEVVELTPSQVTVRPRRREDTGIRPPDITVGYLSWENTRYDLSSQGEVHTKIEGSFSQIPLRLAWAITIHKSQGLTFDRAIVDAANSFAPGQTYVALSRCRTLEGLVLDSPLPVSAIMTDPAVSAFINSQPRLNNDASQIQEFRNSYFCELLYELFNFRQLDNLFDTYYRACAASLPRLFPEFMKDADSVSQTMRTDIMDVAGRLFALLSKTLPKRSDPEVSNHIDGKVRGGAAYFNEKLKAICKFVESTPTALDNKALLKRLVNSRNDLLESLSLHISLLGFFSDKPFSPGDYLHKKTMHIIEAPANIYPGRRRSRRSASDRNNPDSKSRQPGGNDPDKMSEYIENPDLYSKLSEWRRKKAGGKPAFTVLSNKALLEICRLKPASEFELLSVYGISKQKCIKYGSEIISIVENFKEEEADRQQ